MGKFSKALSMLRSSRTRKRAEAQKGDARRQGRRQRVEQLEARHLLSAVTVHETLSNGGGFLTGPTSGDAYDVAMQYLTNHAADLGLNASDVLATRVTDQYTDADTGITHIYLRQTIEGLDVVNTAANISVTADGRVISIGSEFVPNINDALLQGLPTAATALDPAAALSAAGTELKVVQQATTSTLVSAASDLNRSTVLNNGDLSLDPVTAKLQYVATESGLALSWNMQLRTPDEQHWYDVCVDATSGSVLTQDDWVSGIGEEYQVWQLPTEAPNDNSGPGAGERVLLSDVAATTASPDGWIYSTSTEGNNVSAYQDQTPDNTADVADFAYANPSLSFSFPIDKWKDPTQSKDAAVTQLFYVNNILHDVHYAYGFDEAAGNFQTVNYTGLGVGGDAVRAEAQDGGGIDNANFATPPDGFSPRMQMYLFDLTSPRKDGALDNGIVIHEFGHGISHRLVGGASNVNVLNSTQSAAIGEGLSDWWALMLTQKESDTKDTKRSMGTYALGQSRSGKGFRQYAYSFDMVNGATDQSAQYSFPLTYGDYNNYAESHAAGEIFCSALWDLNWILIDKYSTDTQSGFDADLDAGFQVQQAAGSAGGWVNEDPTGAGNRLALKLVMESLKLMPNNPTFLEARDAILQADQIVNGGRDTREIWEAFARRGMGVNADDGGDPDATTIVEDATALPNGPIVIGMDAAATDGAYSSVTIHFSEPVNPTTFQLTDIERFLRPGGVDIGVNGGDQNRLSTYTADSTLNFDPNWWTAAYPVYALDAQVTDAAIGYAARDLMISFQATMLEGTYTLALGPGISSFFSGDIGQTEAAGDGNVHQMDQDRDGVDGEITVSPVTTYAEDAFVGTFTIDRSPGPDAGGYDAVWVDPLNNPYREAKLTVNDPDVLTAVDFAYNASVNLELGNKFDDLGNPSANLFRFYGVDYSSMYVNVNGLITFTGYSNDMYALNGDLTQNPIWPAIAPYWTDWTTNDYFWQTPTTPPGARHQVKVALIPNAQVLYKLDGDNLIVQWDNVRYEISQAPNVEGAAPPVVSGSVTFQAILQLNTGLYDGDIFFNYFDLDARTSAADPINPPPGFTPFTSTALNDGAVQTVGIKGNGVQVATETNPLLHSTDANRLLISMSDPTSPYFFTRQIQGETYYSGIHILRSATAAGRVYNDLNSNGVSDATEPGLAGWLVYADLNNDQVFDWANEYGAVTDANGNYSVTYFPAGTYTIRVVPQGGWQQTGLTSHSVSLASSNTISNLDFGNVADNHAPEILPAAFFVHEHWSVGGADAPLPGTPLQLSPNGSLPGDGQLTATDPDNQPLTYAIINDPGNILNDTFQITAAGVIVVRDPTRLAANVKDTYLITVRVTDNGSPALSATATVKVTVLPNNQAPTGLDEAYSALANQTLEVYKPGVTANDSDPDGDALTPLLVLPPAAGTLTLKSDGSFLYTPDANFIGLDSFTYKLWDGHYEKDLQGNDTNVEVVAKNPDGSDKIFTVTISVGAAQNALTLEFPPETLWESLDVYANKGTVKIQTAPATDLTVTLTSKNKDRLKLLADAVVIRAGETEARFSFEVVQDEIVNGGLSWVGDSPLYVATGANTLQRQGSQDTNTQNDLRWQASSLGTTSLTTPFSGATLLITECGDGDRAFVEMQNVSGGVIDVRGWKLLVNDPSADDANASLEFALESLQTTIPAGQVFYTTDDPSSQYYFGAKIPWSSATKKGWAMILDAQGGIVDFVAWGYSATRLQTVYALANERLNSGPDVRVIATAPGISSAASSAHVGDNEIDHFSFSTISSPQESATEFSVIVYARNKSDETITGDAAGNNGYSGSVSLAAMGSDGPISLTHDQSTTEQPFIRGEATYKVTLGGSGSIVTLTASDGKGHTGQSNSFVVTPTAPDYFGWSTISTPSAAGQPIAVTISALDAAGGLSTGFNGTVRVTGGVVTGELPELLISEVSDASTGYVELQNVSGHALSLDGWTLLFNDPTKTDPAAALTKAGQTVTAYPLTRIQSTLAAGAVLTIDDALVSLFFNRVLPWGAATAKGWAMLVNKDLQVADFVAWGYSEFDIQSMLPTLVTTAGDPGTKLSVGANWYGAGVQYAATASTTLQRSGDRDGDTLDDFAYQAATYTSRNAGMIDTTSTAFSASTRPVAVAPMVDSSLVITECSDGAKPFIEIQNVTSNELALTGWTLVVNDASSSNPNAVASTILALDTLQTSIQGKGILYTTGSTSDHYFGGKIPWSRSTGKGWAMILDPQMNVVDFVAWGYSDSQIQTMTPVINGHTVRVGAAWAGNGVSYGGSLATLQRQGERDNHTASDFAWKTGTMGAANADLSVPFPSTPSLVVTECGDGAKSFVEIENVTQRGIYLTGWQLLVSASVSNPAAALAYDLEKLKLLIGVGETLYVTDQSGENYIGGDIPWSSASGKGWVMILDPQLRIADFAAWGYTDAELQAITPVVDGTTLRGAAAWAGNSVAYAGSATASLQRQGVQDHHTAADFRWKTATMGTENRDLTTPFQVPTYSMLVTAQNTGLFKNGAWTGSILVPSAATQLVLRASDGMGHVGASMTFDVVPQTVAGSDTPAVFDPAFSSFYIRYSQTTGTADAVAPFGPAPNSWIPLAGDWDGDGKTSVGLYDPTTSLFYLSNSTTGGMASATFGFGAAGKGWIPLVGDWDNDGFTTIGLYDPGLSVFYLRNDNSTGVADITFGYGARMNNWTPIVGDWDGDGDDTVGLFIPESSTFFLRNANSTGAADIAFGYGPGGAGWTPLTGDWTGAGQDRVALYDSQTGLFYLRSTLDTGMADITFGYGPAGANWKALMGNWTGTRGSSLLAAAAPLAEVAASNLAATQLQPVVAEAISRFAAAGVDADVLAQMSQAQFMIASLPGAQLGRTEGNVVRLDANAAGRGWFVDNTPAVDEEFAAAADGQQRAIDARAVDRVDLLTVVAHELGHVAGLPDLDLATDSLMSGSLGAGLRRAPKAVDALFANNWL